MMGTGSCCCNVEPDADCTTGATCQSYAVGLTAGSCGFYDRNWSDFIMPIPSAAYYPYVELTGATGDLARANQSLDLVYTSSNGGGALTGCPSGIQFWSGNMDTGPGSVAGSAACNTTNCGTVGDFCEGDTQITLNLYPRGDNGGDPIAEINIIRRWCEFVNPAFPTQWHYWEVTHNFNWDCTAGDWGTATLSDQQKDNSPYVYTGTPGSISVTFPASGARTAPKLVGSGQTTLGVDVTNWMLGGGSFSPLTLKIFNGSTLAEIGSSPVAGAWTLSGSCYIHDPINVALTTTLTHANGVKFSLWYAETELHAKQTASCVLTGLDNPLPAGTILGITPAPFRFTSSVGGGYSTSFATLLNSEILLGVGTNTSLEIVWKDNSNNTEENLGNPGFSSATDSGVTFAKSSSELYLTSTHDGTKLFLQNTDGVGFLQLANVAAGDVDGCFPWFPTGFLQFRG